MGDNGRGIVMKLGLRLAISSLVVMLGVVFLSTSIAEAATPTVSTNPVTGTPYTTAVLDGSIMNNSSSQVTQRGFEYGLDSAYGLVAKEDLPIQYPLDYLVGNNTRANGQFFYATDIAISHSGNMYFGDSYNRRVQQFDSAGNFVTKWGGLGNPLSTIWQVAVDNNDNVYVVDTDLNTIFKFDPQGNYLAALNIGAGSIAFDSHNNMFIASGTSIKKYDTDLNLAAQWGSQGSGQGQFIALWGIAIDKSDNVVVSDTVSRRITKFDNNGNFLTQWGTPGSAPGQFAAAPMGIAIDSANNVFVSVMYAYSIMKFDSSGNFLTQWGTFGTGNGQFNQARRLAVDSSDNVIVADAENKRYQKFTNNGIYLMQYGANPSANGKFYLPEGIATDPAGGVYVADTGNNRIQKFDGGGAFQFKFGTRGSAAGQFNSPSAVATDPGGNVYVLDTGNNRVQKFDALGNYLSQWGSYGGGDGQLNSPMGITADTAGNIYVADTGNNRLERFNSAGIFQSKFGSGGNGDGQFSSPKGLAVDASGNIYVADTGNNRVQKFNSSDSFVMKFGSNLRGNDWTPGPRAIAIDGSGSIFVALGESQGIKRFDATGAFVVNWAQAGAVFSPYDANDGSITYVSGLALDQFGSVFATDGYGFNFEKYSPANHNGDFGLNVADLACDTTYHYRAYAANADGTGYGDDASFTTGICQPDPPFDVLATINSTTSMHLTWTAPAQTGSSQVATYYIEYSPVGGGSWQTANTYSANTVYDLTGLSPGTQYRIKIIAVNVDAYESAESEQIIGTTATPGLHLISDCQGLQAIQNNLDDSYELARDIDCSDTVNWNGGLGFQPIGNVMGDAYFQGVFAGNGFTIKNLYIGGSTEHVAMGMFESTFNAIIQDVTLDNITARQGLSPYGVAYFGAVSGYSISTDMLNVHAKGIDADGPWVYAGGLAGLSYGAGDNRHATSRISKSSATGLIGAHYNNTADMPPDGGAAGGLMGYADLYSVDNSYADIAYSNSQMPYSYGGVAGLSFVARASNTYSAGEVEDTTFSHTIGGIAGYQWGGEDYSSMISDSFSVLRAPANPTQLIAGGVAAAVDGDSQWSHVSNVFFDADALGTINCDPQQLISTCHPISGQPNYFKNNHTNAPMNSWDFDTIWQTTAGLPVFKQSAKMAITAITPERLAAIRAREAAKAKAGASQAAVVSPDPTAVLHSHFVNPVYPTDANPTPPKSLLDRVTQGVTEFVRNLPEGTVRSFPYVLFGMVLAAALLMLYEVRRQSERLKVLKALIAKQRSVAQQRDTFWHIAANYLRAPVTLLIGGAELLELNQSKSQAKAKAKPESRKSAFSTTTLSTLIQGLQAKVSTIMSGIENSQTLRNIQWPPERPLASVVTTARFLVPISLVAGLVLLANYIAIGFRKFEVSTLTLFTQAMVFALVAYALYWALTRLGGVKTRVANAQTMLDRQTKALRDARQELASQTVTSLQTDIAQLQTEVAKIPARNAARRSLSEGASRLKEIIGSFALLNAAETGHLEAISPANTHASLGNVLDTVLQSEQSELTRKQVAIENTLTDIQVPGSAQLNQQVIGSVVDNAVEFSPKNGTIQLQDIQKPGMVGVEITDQGPGVSHEQLSHMLEPFTKADGQDALKMDHEGLGINLYLSKLILERLGGEISVKSTLGRGTSVALWWPAS